MIDARFKEIATLYENVADLLIHKASGQVRTIRLQRGPTRLSTYDCRLRTREDTLSTRGSIYENTIWGLRDEICTISKMPRTVEDQL
jgi:hypothetical protein